MYGALNVTLSLVVLFYGRDRKLGTPKTAITGYTFIAGKGVTVTIINTYGSTQNQMKVRGQFYAPVTMLHRERATYGARWAH